MLYCIVSIILIIQLPELMGTLSGMYEMMDSRIGTLTRLSKLQGKLDLLLSQVRLVEQEQ